MQKRPKIVALVWSLPLLAGACNAANFSGAKGASGADVPPGSGSVAQAGSAAAPGSASDFGPATPPTAVTGINLRCDWNAVDGDEASVSCALVGSDAAPLETATPPQWAVVDAAGMPLPCDIAPKDDGHVVVKADARALATAQIQALVAVDAGAPRLVAQPFAAVLDSLAAGGALAACLAGPTAVAACFQASTLGLDASGAVGRACVLTVTPATARAEAPEPLMLTLVGTAARPELRPATSVFALDQFPPHVVVSGPTTDGAKTTMTLLLQPPTVARGSTAAAGRGRVPTQIAFMGRYVWADGAVACGAPVTRTYLELDGDGVAEPTPGAEPSLSTLLRRFVFRVRNLKAGESATGLALKAASRDFGEADVTIDAPTCGDAGCEQAVFVDIVVRAPPDTTLYQGQILELTLSGATTAIPFVKDLVVGVGSKTPVYTFNGAEGHAP